MTIGRRSRWMLEVQPEALGTHNWAVLCALTELNRSGVIDLRYRTLRTTAHRASARLVVKDGDTGSEHRVALDMHDGLKFSEDDASWADVLFKRSFISALDEGPNRIRPLGLMMGARAPGQFVQAARSHVALALAAARGRHSIGGRKLLSSSRTVALLGWVGASGRPNDRIPELVEEYEHAAPARIERPKISFLVRAWDPRGLNETSAQEFASRSEERAALIRALRGHFGPTFEGGFIPSPYASELYPDCLATVATDRRSFINQTARAGIGISTRGLAGSNPYKLAEYLGTQVAIVTHPLEHDLPRQLVSGENAFFFTDPGTCISACERLLGDHDLLEQLRASNRRYWEEEVRPDRLLLNRLSDVAS